LRIDAQLHPSPMNDAKDCAQSREPELSLIAANSMPRRPRLYNTDPSSGRIVKFYVLGYPLPSDALMKWANDNQIAPDKTNNNRRHLTWQAICRRLPEDCRRWAVVPTEAGSLAHCVVVATNETPEDLNRAEDLEMIGNVQKVVNVHTPPKWYHPEQV